MSAQPRQHWCGWRRAGPRDGWALVATAASWSAAWDRLLQIIGGGGESLVLPAGRDPDQRPAYRRGVR